MAFFRKIYKGSLSEMEHFFSEISMRLDQKNQDRIYFSDFVCQALDMLKPEKEVKCLGRIK